MVKTCQLLTAPSRRWPCCDIPLSVSWSDRPRRIAAGGLQWQHGAMIGGWDTKKTHWNILKWNMFLNLNKPAIIIETANLPIKHTYICMSVYIIYSSHFSLPLQYIYNLATRPVTHSEPLRSFSPSLWIRRRQWLWTRLPPPNAPGQVSPHSHRRWPHGVTKSHDLKCWKRLGNVTKQHWSHWIHWILAMTAMISLSWAIMSKVRCAQLALWKPRDLVILVQGSGMYIKLLVVSWRNCAVRANLFPSMLLYVETTIQHQVQTIPNQETAVTGALLLPRSLHLQRCFGPSTKMASGAGRPVHATGRSLPWVHIKHRPVWKWEMHGDPPKPSWER